MPLVRYALYSRDVEIYIAPTYDSGENRLGTMQHITREGCCRVVVGILYNELDIEKVSTAKRTLDVTEHYSRPDILQLHVNTQEQSPCVFENK